MRMSEAPNSAAGDPAPESWSSASICVEADFARCTSRSSEDDWSCIRTVMNAPSATSATVRATAIVVSTVTRLASERR